MTKTYILIGVFSFVLTSLSGFLIIPYLKKLKFGQTILDIGPIWHKDKQGTPTMGGLMFILGTTLAIILGSLFALKSFSTLLQAPNSQVVRLFSGLIMALAFGFIGFVDDYIKVVKKQNLGLNAKQKLIMQFFVATLYLYTLYINGAISTIVDFPFIGQFNFGFFYYPIMVLFIVYVVNAVNLTDGVDGLATSVTFAYCACFLIICGLLKFDIIGIFAVSLACGCLGFLVWNIHPAKVFMGDTGSMFLGGSVIALGFGIDKPLLILLIGFVFVFEALSVVMQVISYKTTKKRIFKMSPIHHHFEMSGWSENKIVLVFSLVTIILGVIGIFSVKMV